MRKKTGPFGDSDASLFSLWNLVVSYRKITKLNAHDISKKLKVPMSTVLKYFDIMEGREPKVY